MTVFIIGTMNSGKSLLAEDLSGKTGDSRKVYLATMKVSDAEGQKRVAKHRKQREGKGFITIEAERDISGVISKIPDPEETTVLLECVSNLVGNEMHDSPEGWSVLNDPEKAEAFSDRVFNDIKHISEKVHNLFIVSNDYSDEILSDPETELYIRLLNLVNDRLGAFSDRIYDLRKGGND